MARNWKKTVGWAAVGLLVLIVALGVAGYFVVRSQSFQRYVLTTAARKASEATGGQVSIGNYAVRFRPLTITLDHFVIRGTEPERDRALAQADQVTLGLNIVSLISRKIDLTDVEVIHPVVNLIIDRDGKSNIPQPKTPSKNNQPVDVFNLGIQHILLANGEIYYNSRPTPLNAELHDLQTEMQFDSATTAYTGTISYDRGRLQFGTFKALPHTMRARFEATRSGLRVDPVELALASSHVTARANITDYRQPVIEGTYRIALHTQDFRQMLQQPALPAGDVTLEGTLRYQNVPGRAPLQTASTRGTLTSEGLEVSTPTVAGHISNLRAGYELEDGNFRARDLAADLLGGRLVGDLTVRDVAGSRASNLRASLRGISLQAAARSLRSASVRQMPLTGRITANAKASWHGSMQGLVAEADGTTAAAMTIASGIAAGNRGAPSSIPVNGQFHAIYNGDRNLISVSQTELRTPQTLLVMNGTISNASNLQIQLHTKNLHELELLSSSFANTSATQPAKPLNLYGTGILNARMQGSLKRPSLTGQLGAQDLRVHNSNWRTLQVQFAANPESISLRRGTLLSTGTGVVRFNVAAGLHDWKFAPTNPIQADVTADRLSAAQIVSLAGLQYPITGNLNSHISIHGSQLNPVGKGDVQLTQAKIGGIPVQKVSLNFEGTGDAVHSTAAVTIDAGSVKGNLIFYPKTSGYEAQLDAPHIRLDQIPRLRDMQMSGILTASGKGRGTLQQPEGELVASVPELKIRERTIEGLNARIAVANQRADLFLDSKLGSASIRASGDVELTGNKMANLRLDTNGIPLAVLAATFMSRPNQQLQGELEFHANASGPLSQPYEMQGHAEIPILKVDYRAFHIASPRPIQIDYRNGAVVLQKTQLSGTGTNLEIQGTVPIRTQAPAAFSANGTVDVGILQLFSPDITSSGTLQLAINGRQANGAGIEGVGVQGQIKIVNATLATAAAPLGIEGLNGTLLVENNRLEIREFAGNAGGGRFSATGFIGYRPNLAFNVALTANQIRLLYPDGVRTVFNSNLLLEGTPETSTLSGRVLLNGLSFTSSFDLASLMSQSGGDSSGTSTPGPAQNLHLDVALQSAGDLQVVSSQLSLQGQINLKVQGTAAEPVIVGRTDLTGGEVFFMNKRFQIERATAEFNNPNRTEPDLNVLATTVIRQYNISLNLIGPLDRLRTNYISDPPLPPVDIINLLARGQTTEDPSTGNLGANALLAQGLASQVGGQVQKLAGISSLQIDPLIGGNNRNPSARLAIQQRVTKDFFFTFSTDVTSTQDQVVQGEYQISNRWSVSALRNENGNVAVDAKFHSAF